MVSKSKILGELNLILITTGTSNKPFFRLNQSIIELIKKTTLPDNRYNFQTLTNISIINSNVKFINYFKRKDFIKLIKKSNKIITQSSPGNLYYITKYAKNMPLIIARSQNHKEAVGNHQKDFAQFILRSLPNEYKKYIVFKNGNIYPSIKSYILEKSQKNILNKYIFLKKIKKNFFNKLQIYIKKNIILE